MCNKLVFIFVCIKNTLISVYGLKNEVYSCVTRVSRLFCRVDHSYDSFNSTTFRCGPLSELIN